MWCVVCGVWCERTFSYEDFFHCIFICFPNTCQSLSLKVYIITMTNNVVIIIILCNILISIRLSLRWMSQTLRYICLCHSKPNDILAANILEAFGALHDSLGDSAAPDIWHNIVESIRSVSSEQSCDTAIACNKTIAILRRAAEICVGCPETMYSISVCLYK